MRCRLLGPRVLGVGGEGEGRGVPPAPHPTHRLRGRHRRSGELAEEADGVRGPGPVPVRRQGGPVESPARVTGVRHTGAPHGRHLAEPPPGGGTQQRPGGRKRQRRPSPWPSRWPLASEGPEGATPRPHSRTSYPSAKPRPSHNGRFSACQWPGLPSDRKLSPG